MVKKVIDTELKLIAYTRSQLGAPLIDIEVTDEQISEIISDVVQEFTEIAYGTLEGTVCVDLKGKGEYQMPRNVTNIIKVSRGNVSNISNFSANYGSNYVPDLWSQQFFTASLGGDILPNVATLSNTRAMLEKYFGDDIYFNWNPHKKVLQVFEPFKGKAVIHFVYEYYPDEEDMIYDQMWIKKMVTARTKFLWGSVVGKYTASLVGGATINYSDLKSEAQTEIDNLKEELKDRWEDPAPVLIS